MKNSFNHLKIILVLGITGLIAGAIDPLEGSPVIVAGSVLLSTYAFISKHSLKKWFYVSSILIVIGVFFMFYFSMLGGFGGKNSTLSAWWSTLIIPYPLGWLLNITALIFMYRKRPKNQSSNI